MTTLWKMTSSNYVFIYSLQFQSTEKIPGNATSDDNYGNEATTVVPYSSPLLLSHTAISTSIMTPTISRNSISTPTTSIPESKDSSNYHICNLQCLTAITLTPWNTLIMYWDAESLVIILMATYQFQGWPLLLYFCFSSSY